MGDEKPTGQRNVRLIWITIFLTAVLIWSIWWGFELLREPEPVGQGTTSVDFPLPSFQLVNQEGRQVSAEDLKGKVLLIDFVYTHCPDVCPLMSAFMASVQKQVAEEGLLGTDVVLLSLSSDPFRDTPEVLKEYAERYDAKPDSWLFLTSSPQEQLELIEKGFYLSVGFSDREGNVFDPFEGELPSEYEVIHSSRFLLVDRGGQVRNSYLFPDVTTNELTRDIVEFAKG